MSLRIGFLRGINVGGKNLISMSDLKIPFLDLGFQLVETVGNTGVVIFGNNPVAISDQLIVNAIGQKTSIAVKFISISYTDLATLINKAPTWWDEDNTWRHNAIFLTENHMAKSVISEIPELNNDDEKMYLINNTIIWSTNFADRKRYNRSQYHKLMRNAHYPFMTIRNANTLKKAYVTAAKLLDLT